MSKMKNDTKNSKVQEDSSAYKLPNEKFNYGDYLSFDDDIRYEIIDGVLYEMSAPTTMHQMLTLEIATQFNTQLRGKKCSALISPCDVILDKTANRKKAKNVIQPDVMIVCDKSKIEEKGIFGSPDLVVEVMSPSTFKKDKLEKFNLYLKYGVREYWMVYPKQQTVEVNVLEEGKYITYNYSIVDKINLSISKEDKISICLKNFYEQLEIEVEEFKLD